MVKTVGAMLGPLVRGQDRWCDGWVRWRDDQDRWCDGWVRWCDDWVRWRPFLVHWSAFQARSSRPDRNFNITTAARALASAPEQFREVFERAAALCRFSPSRPGDAKARGGPPHSKTLARKPANPSQSVGYNISGDRAKCSAITLFKSLGMNSKPVGRFAGMRALGDYFAGSNRQFTSFTSAAMI